MGGSSVPSSTSQFQQVATGIWGSPQATKLALPILKPALANIKNQQDMLMGFQKGDPEQTRKFLGLPTDAPAEEAVHAIGQLNKPVTSQVQYQPPAKTAAHGGIMSLEEESTPDPRKFATGGDTAPKKPKAPKEVTWSDAQETRRNELTAKQQANQKLTQQERNVLNSLNKTYKGYQTYTDYNKQQTDTSAIQTAGREAGLAPSQAYINQAGYFGFDPEAYKKAIERGDLAGVTTNPLYSQAIRQLQAMEKQPEQFGQATQAYQDALGGLKGAASYTPQQVQAAQAAAAQANRGDIRDIAAQQAQVERYNATHIAPTVREQGVTTAAPKTWTDPGVARQYMNPYTQNVLDQELFEANRQAQMRENQQRSQATQQKAFGGTRAALQESEGRRNLGYLLSDIEQKGLQQAYGQGMGQFQQEQQVGSQVGMSNTQQINQLKSQYMQMGLTEAQANQAAVNAASQFGAAAQNQAYNNYVSQQLAAQQSNQGMDWNTVNLNTSNQQQANIQNAQLAQQAALANQQAGLQANQQNIGAYSQMGNMGQGLGALGTQIGNYGQNLSNMWGQAGGTLQGLGTNWYNQQSQNAGNIWGGPTSLGNQGMNLLGGMGGGQSGNVTQTTQQGR